MLIALRKGLNNSDANLIGAMEILMRTILNLKEDVLLAAHPLRLML